MDVYALLDHRLIDTADDCMQAYNWIYRPFNLVEAIIWFACIPRVWLRHAARVPRGIVVLQCLALLLFGASDLIEMAATSVLLLLFKGAILAALLLGRRAIAMHAATPA